jgi:putative transcriptional regulator
MLLVAGPTLRDPNFARTVVFMCRHDDKGSLGLVINRPTNVPISSLIPEAQGVFFSGGPVARNEVLFLNQIPAEIPGTDSGGIAFGQDMEDLKAAIESSKGDGSCLRVYLGYSGWGEGQLDDELAAGGWIVCPARPEYLFHLEPGLVWQQVLADMGGEYRFLATIPLEPELN